MKFAIKSIMSTIVIFSLTFCFPLFPVAATIPNYVKVGLAYGPNGYSDTTVASVDGLMFGTVSSNNSFDKISDLENNKTAYISKSLESKEILIKDKSGTELARFKEGVEYIIYSQTYDSGGKITMQGTQYRGGAQFIISSSGKLNMINRLTLRDYLYGNVHFEMGYSNPIEALKAQAIVSKNYVSTSIDKHESEGFDVCATTHCQMYKGAAGEYPSIINAVDSTDEIFMYYKGDIVQAFYSKNSGGYTVNSEDAWSAKIDYLRAVADPHSPSYPWNASFTFDEIKSKLVVAGKNIGNVKEIRATKVTISGDVTELKIIGTSGDAVFSKEGIKSFFGGSTIIKSLKFSFGNVSKSTTDTTLLSEVYIISGNEKVTKLKTENIFISDGKTKVKWSDVFKIPIDTVYVASDSPLSISGRGYGHGVGMPQDSAVKMAEKGYSFEEILKFYYLGVEVK